MQCSGIRTAAKKPCKKKPRCQLLTARPGGVPSAYFIIIAFCDFM